MLSQEILDESSRWIDHQGIRVLIVSYAAARSDHELLDIMARQVNLIRAEEAKVRVVHDYRNAPIGEQFLEQAIQKSKSHRTVSIERAAVLGLAGFRKNLFHRYRMETGDTQARTFDTLEEALEWVIA